MQQNQTMLEPDWGFDIGVTPQFELHAVEVRDNQLYITGVSHSSIKLKGRFSKISQFMSHVAIEPTEGNKLATINLKVTSISAYHTQLNRLNSGMQARLACTGDFDTVLETLQTRAWQFNEATRQWQPSTSNTEKLVLSK
ncbi:MAG: hypothetical protein AAF846_17325 [Chloroflexota bacterium]